MTNNKILLFKKYSNLINWTKINLNTAFFYITPFETLDEWEIMHNDNTKLIKKYIKNLINNLNNKIEINLNNFEFNLDNEINSIKIYYDYKIKKLETKIFNNLFIILFLLFYIIICKIFFIILKL